jgi:hypothetical protein
MTITPQANAVKPMANRLEDEMTIAVHVISVEVYLFDVSRTDDLNLLHHLQRKAEADADLLPSERLEVVSAINSRLSWLNARTVSGEQKPRW